MVHFSGMLACPVCDLFLRCHPEISHHCNRGRLLQTKQVFCAASFFMSRERPNFFAFFQLFKMATLSTNTRYTTTDWHTNNHVIATNADRQRNASHDIRQEARFLRNETDNKTKWDQHDNNTRLADRVDIIRKWKDTLERTLGELDKEIADLNTAKDETEIALENMNLPTEVNVENLTTREGRQNIDVVEDEIEDELLKV